MFRKEVLEAQFEFPFGDGSVNLVNTAEEEARKFRHNYLGTEHLLLGYTSVETSNLFNKLGIDTDRVRGAIEFIVGRGDKVVTSEEDLSFTPRGRETIRLGIIEAKQLDDKSLEPDHIMLGLVREGEGIAAGILEQLGLNLNKVRKGVIEIHHKQAEIRKPDSLDILRAFLSDPNQDQAKQIYLNGVLNNLTGLLLPPSERK